MSDAAFAVCPDCPPIPDDTQWYEMYQVELLCGKEGELCIYSNVHCTVHVRLICSGAAAEKPVKFQKPQPGIPSNIFFT